MNGYLQFLFYTVVWLTYGYDTRLLKSIVAMIITSIGLLYISLQFLREMQANTTEMLNAAPQLSAQGDAHVPAFSWSSLILNGIVCTILMANILICLLRFRETRVLDPDVSFYSSGGNVAWDSSTPDVPPSAQPPSPAQRKHAAEPHAEAPPGSSAKETASVTTCLILEPSLALSTVAGHTQIMKALSSLSAELRATVT